MAEDGTDTRLAQTGDGSVGMLGRVLDVGPVEEGGRACTQRRDRAEEVTDPDVLGLVRRPDSPEHFVEVLEGIEFGVPVPHDALPGVAVSVDEAGKRDHAVDVDDLDARFDVDPPVDSGDQIVADQDVGSVDVSDGRIDADDRCSPEECAAWAGMTRP